MPLIEFLKNSNKAENIYLVLPNVRCCRRLPEGIIITDWLFTLILTLVIDHLKNESFYITIFCFK